MTRVLPSDRPCEVCGKPATHLWGWDGTDLCDEHYDEANRRYAAVERAAQEKRHA